MGLPRHGKTLLQTIFSYYANLEGLKIYSNFKLNLENAKLINPNDLLEFELTNCLLNLDEVTTICDSRVNSKGGRLLSYFVMQSGKRDVHIIWTAQLMDMVDGRLTDVTNLFIKSVKTKMGFKLIFIQPNTLRSKKVRLPFDIAEKFYSMYDTRQVIYPMDIKPTGDSIDFNSIIRDVLEAPTKKSFIATIRTNNPWIPESTAQGIYDYIKNNQVDKAKRLLRLESKNV